MAFIRTTDLCKTYGSGENLVRAVHKVSLEIEKGDMLGIGYVNRNIRVNVEQA